MIENIPNEEMLETHPEYDHEHASELYDTLWNYVSEAKVVDLKKMRSDLITWRRGSAQMALKINPLLINISIYSVLLSNITPTEELYLHLLAYNNLQRRECLGLLHKENRWFVILKYTMELEIVDSDALVRHVYHLQEVADKLDTEMAEQFGGQLHFEDWDRMAQGEVDNLLDDLFG